MSQKCKEYDLPFNGAKSGVKVHTNLINYPNIDSREDLARAFAVEFKDYLGSWIGAPDMGTGEIEMNAIAYELQDLSVVTGKSVKFGGLEGRREATGYGGYCILKQLKDIETVAIQGFGNVGEHFAEFVSADNYIILGATDKDGAVIGELNNEELLSMEVDCLALCACENQITLDNAKEVKAKTIIELANGGISKDALPVLKEMKVKVIPDYISNSGGVIASYLEWLSNTTGERFDKEYVFKFIKNKMKLKETK
jgi:glutamate dehydrogenase (NADP+)